MPTGEEYLTDTNGMVWVQPGGPGTPCYPLLCHILDAVDIPIGDISSYYCRDASGKWNSAHRSQGGPSDATFTVGVWLSKTRQWMQKMAERKCAIPFYFHHSECAPYDVFVNYDVGMLAPWGFITNKGRSNSVLQRGESNQATTITDQAFDVTCEKEPPEYWKLVASSPTIAEDEELRDIAICNDLQCAGGCGELIEVCTTMVVVADSAAGVPSDVWFTANGGTDWTAAATSPFLLDEDICSVVCFPLDRDRTRVVVLRGTTDAANPAEVGYSDDLGATWLNADVETVNAGYGMHGGALFSLGQRQTWCGTDLGNISISTDACVTWTDQNAPDPSGVAEEIYCIHFVDSRYGWAVGDNQAMWHTSNGGDNWVVVATPPGIAAHVNTGVAVLDRHRAWVSGTTALGAGALYLTRDNGATWTDYTGRLQLAVDGGTIPNLGDVKFLDEFCGAVTGTWNDGADDYVMTWVTRNGGWDWEAYYDANKALDGAVVYQGGNAVVLCDYNHALTVGEVSDALGLINEFTAVGSV